MRNILITCLLSFGIVFSSCEEFNYDGYLKIKNNSDLKITYIWACVSDSISQPYVFGDLNREEINELINSSTIEPGDSFIDEFKIEAVKNQLSTLTDVYTIINTDTLKKYSLEEIESRNLILKRYIFDTYEDMKAINFEMTYP